METDVELLEFALKLLFDDRVEVRSLLQTFFGPRRGSLVSALKAYLLSPDNDLQWASGTSHFDEFIGNLRIRENQSSRSFVADTPFVQLVEFDFEITTDVLSVMTVGNENGNTDRGRALEPMVSLKSSL